MKLLKHPLLVTFLLFTALTTATTNMIENPFNLTTETELSENNNPEILSFWELNAQTGSFLGVDKKKIHTTSITTGNNKVIVINQGRTESALKYKELAYDLNSQGYDIFFIDHRGQGLSERLGGDQYRGHVQNFQDYVTDLHQYISSLALENRYDKRYLLSHSMGGAISALYLEQYPTPFQAGLFFSPMLSINLGALPTWLAKVISYSSAYICSWFSDKACYVPMGKEYIKQPFEENKLTHSKARYLSGQAVFTSVPETQLGDPSMRWLATSLSATEQAIENADNINIPILILQAGSDEIVTSEGQNAFFQNAQQCKENKLIAIAGAKHEILLERDEYRLLALNHALEFLSKASKGATKCTK